MIVKTVRNLSLLIFLIFIFGWNIHLSARSSNSSGLGGLYRSMVRPQSGVVDEEYREAPLTVQKEKENFTERLRRSNPTPIEQEEIEPEIPSPGQVRKKNTHSIAREDSTSDDIVSDARTRQSPGVDEDPIHYNLLPEDLTPTRRGWFYYHPPKKYRGLYISNSISRNPRKYKRILTRGKELGINTLVVDVQRRMPPSEFVRYARDMNFYLVARVVVFEGGLDIMPPPMDHINSVIDYAENAAKRGFMEIQLDYIRFSDFFSRSRLNLTGRYHVIAGILKMATERLRPYGVRLGADIFGRIAFNRDDLIGQKLELFADHLDTIYPMLYPSHFYGMPDRQGDPYGTIFDGVNNSVSRIGKNANVIAYIQAFRMHISPSRLSYTDYIEEQIAASEDAKGSGYVVWNATNEYEPFFQALEAYNKKISIRKESEDIDGQTTDNHRGERNNHDSGPENTES